MRMIAPQRRPPCSISLPSRLGTLLIVRHKDSSGSEDYRRSGWLPIRSGYQPINFTAPTNATTIAITPRRLARLRHEAEQVSAINMRVKAKTQIAMVTYSYDPTYLSMIAKMINGAKAGRISTMTSNERSRKAYFREIPFHQSDLITDRGRNSLATRPRHVRRCLPPRWVCFRSLHARDR